MTGINCWQHQHRGICSVTCTFHLLSLPLEQYFSAWTAMGDRKTSGWNTCNRTQYPVYLVSILYIWGIDIFNKPIHESKYGELSVWRD